MERGNYIRDEIREISPTIASINLQHIYSVPVNYFEGLASEILQKIQSNYLYNPVPVLYKVPSDYFNGLAILIHKEI